MESRSIGLMSKRTDRWGISGAGPIVLASDTLELDSDLETGGGTDDTEALQAAINSSVGGTFIQDGVSLISDVLVNDTTHTAAIMIPSNTRIVFNPGCGWYLDDDSNCNVMSNAGITGDVNATRDENITIEADGFAINANGANNSHTERDDPGNASIQSIWFGNCSNVLFIGLEMLNAPRFAITFGNCENITLTDCFTNWTVAKATYQDGLHLYGPLDNLTTTRFRSNGGDDAFGHNTNEGVFAYQTSDPSLFGRFRFPQSGDGDITNVTHNQPNFDGCWAGIRIYGLPGVTGSNPHADNITINGARGSIGDPGDSRGEMHVGTDVLIGTLTFNDWDVTEVGPNNGITVTNVTDLYLDDIAPGTTVSYGATNTHGNYFGAIAQYNLASTADEIGTYPLTNNNGAAFGAGKVGNAVTFNGTNSYLSSATLNIANSYFTIVGWVKLVGGTAKVVMAQYSSVLRWQLYHDTDNTLHFLAHNSAPTGLEAVTAALTPGTWTFFAIQQNTNTNAIRIKLNNGAWVSQALGSAVYAVGTPAPFTMGANMEGGGDTPAGFSNCSIDAVRIYDSIISDADITALYNGGTGIE